MDEDEVEVLSTIVYSEFKEVYRGMPEAALRIVYGMAQFFYMGYTQMLKITTDQMAEQFAISTTEVGVMRRYLKDELGILQEMTVPKSSGKAWGFTEDAKEILIMVLDAYNRKNNTCLAIQEIAPSR